MWPAFGPGNAQIHFSKYKDPVVTWERRRVCELFALLGPHCLTRTELGGSTLPWVAFFPFIYLRAFIIQMFCQWCCFLANFGSPRRTIRFFLTRKMPHRAACLTAEALRAPVDLPGALVGFQEAHGRSPADVGGPSGSLGSGHGCAPVNPAKGTP